MNGHGGELNPQSLERWILQSNDPSQPTAQMQAIIMLRDWSLSSPREVVIASMFQVLDQSSEETAQFYSLGTLGRMPLDETERASFRQYLLYRYPPASSTFLRNKVAWILARFLWEDVPMRWTTLEHDLIHHLSVSQPALFCKILETAMEEFSAVVIREDPNNVDYDEEQTLTTNSSFYSTKHDMRRVKDYFKDYINEYGEATGKQPNDLATNTLAHRLFDRVVKVLEESIVLLRNGNDANRQAIETVALALKSMRQFLMWIDLFPADTQGEGAAQSKAIEILLYLLSVSDYPAHIHVLTFQVLKEWNSGAQSTHATSQVSDHELHVYSAVFEQIHKANLLPYNVESSAPIEVVIEVAKFVDSAGQHLLNMFVIQSANATSEIQVNADKIKSALFQALDLFFRAFSYDDIDVSAAVFPLSGNLISEMEKQASLRMHLPQLLNVLYSQMKYPADFSYDYEDELVAEEMTYRADLAKLFGKMVRIDSNICLQFVVETAQRMEGISKAPTQDVEVFLRLLYHFCEGLRPSPGLKVVMKNQVFCSLLTALHNSDIADHPHREVLCLYYETSVRYHPIFMTNSGNAKVTNTPLLSRVLEAMVRLRS
ncbi:hypothetical protein FisN_19Hh189 [Fistulifera solaris]|jgi:hypothetical protein|uniref:Exportin-T n=1 Tax=Fistulifera solaris TaxID=1519565 RepID=A0A1Z5K0B8_FISSO|nr:hypothetical protein FisN_19Hh189 [Fistulifera solaris]|eukprot:GAX19609.1 hypothetical protein FisN_19Hh189 [Fistulifera solaris]